MLRCVAVWDDRRTGLPRMDLSGNQIQYSHADAESVDILMIAEMPAPLISWADVPFRFDEGYSRGSHNLSQVG